MSKETDKLDKILESIEELTDMLVEDITRGILEDEMDWEGEAPSDAIQAFRITERVFNEMEKELGEGWMDHMGIT